MDSRGQSIQLHLHPSPFFPLYVPCVFLTQKVRIEAKRQKLDSGASGSGNCVASGATDMEDRKRKASILQVNKARIFIKFWCCFRLDVFYLTLKIYFLDRSIKGLMGQLMNPERGVLCFWRNYGNWTFFQKMIIADIKKRDQGFVRFKVVMEIPLKVH